MRRAFSSAFALVAAVLLIVAAAGAAVEMGAVDSEDINPVGGAEAAIGIGTVAVALVVGAATGATATAAYDHFFGPGGVNETALEQADAEETKISIHQQATAQQESNGLIQTSFNNHLEDSIGSARRAATNAYIRELNNGSTEAVAQSKAYGAIDDYYAGRQDTVLKSWQKSMVVSKNLRGIAANKSGVSESFVAAQISASNSESSWSNAGQSLDGFSDTTVSLVNGSTRTATGFDFSAEWGTSSGTSSAAGTANLTNQEISNTWGTATFEKLEVQAPTENFNSTDLIDVQEYAAHWSAIEDQRDTVRSNVDNLITSTFDAYQEGDINNSDLIDPYLGAREYSPVGEFGSWSMLMLQNMGLSPPEDAGTMGSMTVEDLETDETITGMLMSDGTPEDGFSVGETYNASDLTGLQYVIDEDAQSQHELNGEFTLVNATTTDGETVGDGENIEYRDVDYESADDTAEFRAALEELRNSTAQVEARQQRLRNPSGGGGLFDGVNGISLGLGFGLEGPQALLALVVGMLSLLAAIRAVLG